MVWQGSPLHNKLNKLFNTHQSSIRAKSEEYSKVTYLHYFLVVGVSLLLYLNSLEADFAYDDSRAIERNQDILPSTPWYKLLQDDFWGTPISSTNTHGSYRPIVVLSFRFNYMLHGLSPFGFHLFNVALHVAVTLLYMNFVAQLVNFHTRITLVSSFLFASHPIHVESVTSIVGRADVGAAMFYLLALKFYINFVKTDQKNREHKYLYFSLLLSSLSMLCKEHGITCLAVCAVYHLFIIHRFFPFSKQNYFNLVKEPSHARLRKGLFHLSSTLVILILVRVAIMGTRPSFSPADNPASDSAFVMVRFMTFVYLASFNFWLLIYPRWLSFDWSMEAIPLISSVWDVRNLFSLIFYGAFTALVVKIGWFYYYTYSPKVHFMPRITLNNFANNCPRCDSIHNKPVNSSLRANKTKPNLIDDIDPNNNNSSSINLNHISASNNVNFNLPFLDENLNNQLVDNNNNNNNEDNITIVPTSIKTRRYNSVKFNNQPTTHSNRLHRIDCLAFSVALMVIPFLPATNLFFYVGFVVAERILYVPSFGFCLFVAISIESVIKLCRRSRLLKHIAYICLCLMIISFSLRTILRNVDWLTEENLYRSGISINPPKAYGNLANILSMKGKKKEAEMAYRKALEYRSSMADVHYNLGILLQEQSRYAESLESYQQAIRYRPRLAMAYLNMGIVLVQLNRKEQAKQVYRQCAELDGTGLKDVKLHETTKISALYNLGRIYAEEDHHEKALKIYKEAVARMPPYYQPQSLFNVIGEAYSKLNQSLEAEKWFKKSLMVKGDHIPAHLTYAKLLAKMNRNVEAERLLKKALLLNPNDTLIYQHYGQFMFNMAKYDSALDLFNRAFKISPQNFDIVVNIANTLRELKKPTEAETFYELATKLRPFDLISHSNLGAIYHLNGKFKLAEKSYLRALEIKPNDPITSTNLAKLRQLIKSKAS